MCTFIFYFYIWECDLSSFPEEYCLDKFLVNISFMVIYYLILKAIAFQILSYFYWASSISVYATDTAVLCYFIFRLIFMDIAGNNISVSNFLSFFFLFWDLGVVGVFVLEVCQLLITSCPLIYLYFAFSFDECWNICIWVSVPLFLYSYSSKGEWMKGSLAWN